MPRTSGIVISRDRPGVPDPGIGEPWPGERAKLQIPRAVAGFFLARRRQPDHEPLEGFMARGDVRIAVTLACEECKHRNYQTNKSKRNNPDRVSLRKYCRWCRKHTSHRETR